MCDVKQSLTAQCVALLDPLLAQGRAVLFAIDGNSASGKTTLAAQLARYYDANVFHTDDFFLRPEQRTPKRFAQPGGNMDRERFALEVLEPLSHGHTVQYRCWDCATLSMQPAVTILPKTLNIIEGAYCMHPELEKYYHLSIFLHITPEAQRARLAKRESPEKLSAFLTRWLPLEQQYFDILQPQKRCTRVLEVEE